MPFTIERIRQLLGPGLEQLAGAHAAGEIPLTDAVINALIADYLPSAALPVASLEVRTRERDELDVRIRLRKPALAPAVTLSLRIDQQPLFPSPATLGLRWSLAGFAAVAPVIGSILSVFRGGPPWMVMHGDRVLIDLAAALRERLPPEALTSITSLRFATRAGALVVAFELRR